MQPRPAVFCDRDGVLSCALVQDGIPYPPRSLGELALESGVTEGCRDLHDASMLIIVVTNQPDVARGALDTMELRKMHRRLARLLPLDAIYVCTHDDGDDCDCRKPKPGMLYTAAGQLGIDLSESYVIGDRWRDIAAGRQAGCRTIHIDRRYRERQPDSADFVADDFLEAVQWILRHRQQRKVAAETKDR